jgi:hypothetical protein
LDVLANPLAKVSSAVEAEVNLQVVAPDPVIHEKKEYSTAGSFINLGIAMEPQRSSVTTFGWTGFQNGASDADPAETKEWLEALDGVLRCSGPQRGHHLLNELLSHARACGLQLSGLLNTPYCNTIPRSEQPEYPGDLELERQLTGILRWNALAMVMRANKESSELGGHLASYASAADLFEVGFNHFFRGSGDRASELKSDLVGCPGDSVTI